jgi:hypothetical protein
LEQRLTIIVDNSNGTHEYGRSPQLVEHIHTEHTPIAPHILTYPQLPLRTAYPTPALTEKCFVREDSMSYYFADVKQTRTTTMRELRKAGKFSRLKEHTPDPHRRHANIKSEDSLTQHRKIKNTQSQALLPEAVRPICTSSAPPSKNGELTLADIADFGLRMKVAKLMAIAPVLPVRDLHDLLIEMKGHYEEAEDQVFHYISQAPQSSVCQEKPIPAPESTKIIHQSDEGDAMFKVDLDNPDIYLDNDIPSSPSPPPVSKKALPTKKRNHPRIKSRKPTKKNSTPKKKEISAIVPVKHKPKTGTGRAPTTIGLKRSLVASKFRKSYDFDQEFIVIDDDSEDDESYEDRGSVRDSADEGGDSDMEEDPATALHIDMKRPFYTPGDEMETGD